MAIAKKLLPNYCTLYTYINGKIDKMKFIRQNLFFYVVYSQIVGARAKTTTPDLGYEYWVWNMSTEVKQLHIVNP